MEDLRGVVTRTASKSGINGPNSPVTQYMLAEAASQLSQRLRGDFTGTSPPRLLSALIGHEPFVEDRLFMSPHQMRRRWPIAADWYGDLIAYVLRPHRHASNARETLDLVQSWLQLPFGQFVARFASQQATAIQDPQAFGLPSTLYAIWPDYQPVRDAYQTHRNSVAAIWTPLYQLLLNHYRLALRPGVRLDDLCWALDGLVTQGGVDASLRPHNLDPERTGRTILTFVLGAVTAEGGAELNHLTLSEREPGT